MYRWLDEHIGSLLCYFFSFLNLFNIKRKITSDSKNKIIILKFYEMGCIVLLQPCLKALRQKYPNSKIYFITIEKNKEIIEMMNIVDNIFTINDNNIFSFTMDILEKIKKLRNENIDVLIDLEFLTRFSAITTFLISAKKSVGFYSRKVFRGNFYNEKVDYSNEKHITKIYKETFKKLDIDVEYKIPFELNYEILENLNEFSGKIISVNINSNAAIVERRWPKEYFIEIVKFLQKTSYKIILVGSKVNEEYVNSFIKLLADKNIENYTGNLSLKQLAGLFKISKLVITNDSGPLHLAYAMGTATFSFFGPESPAIFGPIGNNHKIFYKNLSCSPCVDVYNGKKVKCTKKTVECLNQIKPEEVIEELKKML